MYRWDFSVVANSAGLLWSGLLVTLTVSFCAMLIGTLGSFVLVFLAEASKLGLIVVRLFTEFFLAVPVLVLLIWLYYGGPTLGVYLSGIAVGVLALSLSLSAFLAESIRGGIKAVPDGEILAARMLGLCGRDVWRYIVLPQALRVALPSMVAQYITCIKLSSLCAVIAVNELTYAAQTAIAVNFRPLELYSAAAGLYMLLVLPLSLLARRIERTGIRSIGIPS